MSLANVRVPLDMATEVDMLATEMLIALSMSFVSRYVSTIGHEH
jgi:hypothetical protein